MSIAHANAAASEYGFSIGKDGRISKAGRNLGVSIRKKGRGFYAETDAGVVVWSGPNVGFFLEKFYFAEKVNRNDSP